MGNTLDAIVQVAAEGSGGDGGRQVAIGGGDHTHVGADRLVATHALKLPLLQHPQQGDLRLRGQLAHLIQEERSSIGQLKASQVDAAAPR